MQLLELYLLILSGQKTLGNKLAEKQNSLQVQARGNKINTILSSF